MDLVDMHEAFAAQVLSVVKMLGSDAFARARLGRDKAVGEIDPARLNVHGGSVALGHPFGATGARMVLTMANELHDTGKKHALLGICAAGGLGAAAVLHRELARQWAKATALTFAVGAVSGTEAGVTGQTAVYQHHKFYFLGSAKCDHGIHRGPDRPAFVEHIVDEYLGQVRGKQAKSYGG